MTLFLTRSTFIAVLILFGASLASGQNLQKARGLLERLDANNDKIIERQEVPAEALPAFEKLLKAADDNKDGKIDTREFRAIFQSAAAKGAAAPGMANAAARVWAMDSNKDGKVSREEFTGPPALFDRLDADKDGTIGQSELPKPAADAPGPKSAKTEETNVPPMFQAMDKDQDGKISKQEFTGPEALFSRIDADSDGSLTKAEASRFADATKARVKAMDQNGDNKISKDEFKGRPEAFDRLDRDKDGSLTAEEFATPGMPPAAGKAAIRKALGAAKAKKSATESPKPSTPPQP